MQRRAGRQDDEVHHDTGEEHAGKNIGARRMQFKLARPAPLRQRHPAERASLFDFLRGLPKEKIW